MRVRAAGPGHSIPHYGAQQQTHVRPRTDDIIPARRVATRQLQYFVARHRCMVMHNTDHAAVVVCRVTHAIAFPRRLSSAVTRAVGLATGAETRATTVTDAAAAAAAAACTSRRVPRQSVSHPHTSATTATTLPAALVWCGDAGEAVRPPHVDLPLRHQRPSQPAATAATAAVAVAPVAVAGS